MTAQPLDLGPTKERLADNIWYGPGRAETEALVAEAERLRSLCGQIVNILGPEPTGCGCDGCQVEMSEALALAQQALEAS